MTVVYWHLHCLKLDDWPKFPFRVERRSDRRTSDCCCPLKSLFSTAVLPPTCEALKSTLHLPDLLSLSTQPNSVKFFFFFFSRGAIVKRVIFIYLIFGGRLMPWSWHIAAFSSCHASSSTGLSGLLQRKVSLMTLRLFCVGSSSSRRCNETRHLNANDHTKELWSNNYYVGVSSSTPSTARSTSLLTYSFGPFLLMYLLFLIRS